MRVVFMGTPDFAVPALAALTDAGHEIVCVYTQPPRRAGRGQKMQPSPVQAFAEERGIPARHPASLKDETAQQDFADLDADIGVVAAYGLILPKAVLDAPRHGCLNIHASLLPRWRGAAPIQRAIEAGDAETGITIMRMDKGLDTGDMLLGETIAITPETTGGSLHDQLAEIGARLIVEALEKTAAGALEPRKQPEDGVTYAKKLDRHEGRLDWTRPADELERRVRAFTPWPGSWFVFGEDGKDDERIRVLAAEAVDRVVTASPGEVLDDALTVACRTGALRLARLQRAGRGAMDTTDFLRGFAIPKGTVLNTGGDESGDAP